MQWLLGCYATTSVNKQNKNLSLTETLSFLIATASPIRTPQTFYYLSASIAYLHPLRSSFIQSIRSLDKSLDRSSHRLRELLC